MKDKQSIFTLLIVIGAAIAGAIVVSCSSIDFTDGGSPAPAAPC